jgi:hypothetical protein
MELEASFHLAILTRRGDWQNLLKTRSAARCKAGKVGDILWAAASRLDIVNHEEVSAGSEIAPGMH